MTKSYRFMTIWCQKTRGFQNWLKDKIESFRLIRLPAAAPSLKTWKIQLITNQNLTCQSFIAAHFNLTIFLFRFHYFFCQKFSSDNFDICSLRSWKSKQKQDKTEIQDHLGLEHGLARTDTFQGHHIRWAAKLFEHTSGKEKTRQIRPFHNLIEAS